MRKLATVRKVASVSSIPDADAINKLVVDGWELVSAKSAGLKEGDLVVYFEIDSFMPEDERWTFLEGGNVRKMIIDGEEVARPVIRTMRMRGQVSQGMALDLKMFDELADHNVGDDVTEKLGIIKWEPPIPAELAGESSGVRPSFAPMTDAERIQNITNLDEYPSDGWVASEKIDGTSATYALERENGSSLISAGRKWAYDNPNNTIVKLGVELGIEEFLRNIPHERHIVLQGEVFGPKIQKNPLKVSKPTFAAFRLIVDGRDILLSKGLFEGVDIEPAPLIGTVGPLPTVEEAVELADNMTSAFPNGKPEGIVWRYYGTEPHTGEFCVKSISRNYLLAE